MPANTRAHLFVLSMPEHIFAVFQSKYRRSGDSVGSFDRISSVARSSRARKKRAAGNRTLLADYQVECPNPMLPGSSALNQVIKSILPPHLLQDLRDRQESLYPQLWTCEESRETRLFERSKSPGWDGSLLSSYPSFWSGPVMPFRCPWCQSERTRRSKTRGFFEAFLAKLYIRPFRCHDCDCRFFRRSASLKSHPGMSVSPSRFSTLRTARGTPGVSLPK